MDALDGSHATVLPSLSSRMQKETNQDPAPRPAGGLILSATQPHPPSSTPSGSCAFGGREARESREGKEKQRGSRTRIVLTFLAAVCSPAAVVVLVVDGRLLAQGLLLHRPRTQVPAFLWGFVPHDVVIGHRVQDQGPVHRGEVTEVGIFLNPDGPPSNVPQIVKPNILEIGHLEDDQGVIVKELPAADDREVREEVPEALEAGHAEQQQVLGDDRELGEAVAAVVLCLGDEQDVEVALDHRAVLQTLQLLIVVADVDARPAD